jgi:hypothetical protein
MKEWILNPEIKRRKGSTSRSEEEEEFWDEGG